MGLPAKRRSSSRHKVQKAAKRSAPTVATRSWANEALAVIMFLSVAFFGVSFLSHQLSQSMLSPVVSGQPNIMGPVGHVLGTLLAGFFGWCALAPILWFFWLGVYFWRNEDLEGRIKVDSNISVLFGIVGVFLLASTLGWILAGGAGGGSAGMILGSPMSRFFGYSGAIVIASAFLLLSIGLACRISVANLLRNAFVSVSTISRLLLITTPTVLARLVLWIGEGLWAVAQGGLSALSLGLIEFKPKAAESVSVPTPKRHKLTVHKGRKEEPQPAIEDEEESQPMEESYSHIVVNRRQPEEFQSAKARKLEKERIKERERQEDDIVVGDAYVGYEPPNINLLSRGEPSLGSEDDEELLKISRQIEGKLKDFGILGRVTEVHPGPVITTFEFEPAPGVKVGRIVALQDDLAMALKTISVRIVAPIPKKGTVGIEVPNRQRDIVRLRDVLECEAYAGADSILMAALGKDTYGEPIVSEISTMPHLLMAGATGTGKSVCINAILLSLLYKAHPSELGLILIDPKILELHIYDGIPHLRVPVVTVAKQAKAVLDWAANEMNRRYRVMQRFGVRNIDSYNRVARGEVDRDQHDPSETVGNLIELKDDEVIAAGTVEKDELLPEDVKIAERIEPLPKIVIVIDELADLMLTVGRDIEEVITRLAQKARAAGIHLIIATQRPSVDVITGLIKANFPARLSFKVTSRIDSRTILDSMGAEKLLGRGDMLFMLPGEMHLRRVHGAFVSDNEVKKVVSALKKTPPRYDDRIMRIMDKALEEDQNASGSGSQSGESAGEEYDEFYDKALELVLEKGQASTSMVQRVFRIGYNRAARIIEQMEREGVIGPMDGVKPRQVILPGGSEEIKA